MDRGISPRVTNTVDLGSASKVWRKLYATEINLPTEQSASFLNTLHNAFAPDAGASHNSIYRGAEINDDWATIQANIQAGDFENYYIGDYKEITLTTGEKVVMEIAGISNYKNHGDTAIGNHLDFISRDCLQGAKQWNATATNNGTADEKRPWLASDLYQALNDESTGVFAKLPSDLKSAIIPKRALLEERYSAAGAITADSSWSWADAGKLWLPTEIEVFGHPVWSEPGYGTGGGGCNKQYPIFMGNSKHLIKGDGNGGSRVYWWLLSVYRVGASGVCCVSGYGYAGHASAAGTGIRAPLCFRIG